MNTLLFIVDDLLSTDALAEVNELIRKATFTDGRITANVPITTKNNAEMDVGDVYLRVSSILNAAVETSSKVITRIVPRFRTNPIINRYGTGMFFREHTDAPIQGGVTQFGRTGGRFGQNFIRTDYSMTLFLSDPASYDGGELELRVMEDTKTVKLRPGSAVCYATGIPHAVRTITRGSRIAAIYWFQSMIRDVQIRHVLSEQCDLEERLTQIGQHELAERARSVRNDLVRYLAEI
jgi:PKHD-type hydroxylase